MPGMERSNVPFYGNYIPGVSAGMGGHDRECPAMQRTRLTGQRKLPKYQDPMV